jgi:hypothetical protein
VLTVEASTNNADGVHLLLDNGEQIELTLVRPGEFAGQIPIFTALDNGKHTAVLQPWREMIVGESVEVDYVIALPQPGSEIEWDISDLNGSVAAIAVLPDGRPVEFGTYQEMGEPHCYLHLRDKKGKPVELVEVLAPAYCRAIDLKIDRESGRMHILVERKQGDEIVWWAGELSAWGKGPKNIGIGKVGDTAFALAGLAQGVQSRALALDLDDQGRFHLAGDSCLDTCEPAGELWTYEPGGTLVEHTSLGPLGSPWFGPSTPDRLRLRSR